VSNNCITIQRVFSCNSSKDLHIIFNIIFRLFEKLHFNIDHLNNIMTTCRLLKCNFININSNPNRL